MAAAFAIILNRSFGLLVLSIEFPTTLGVLVIVVPDQIIVVQGEIAKIGRQDLKLDILFVKEPFLSTVSYHFFFYKDKREGAIDVYQILYTIFLLNILQFGNDKVFKVIS